VNNSEISENRKMDYSRIALIPVILLSAIALTNCGAGVSPFTKQFELEPPKPGESPYVYVPFEVPNGANAVVVELAYDNNDGKNRVELGVFDQRFKGNGEDKDGFRGWSGSVRNQFFIAPDDATYGYSKGTIEPGKWYVILGLAQIEESGIKARQSSPLKKFPLTGKNKTMLSVRLNSGIQKEKTTATSHHSAGIFTRTLSTAMESGQ